MSEINYELHKREKYADPSPYPEVKVLGPNLYYAELLMDDYAGVTSEFTAINQYLYHYFFFEDIDEELGELLENVAINEMLHMEILAETIKKLGGNPVIRGSYSTNGNYWHGGFIYYGTQLCERLKANIEAEYKAIENYQKHICLIADPNVQAILQRIILDEKVHIKLFNQALRKFCGCEYRADS
ncbi:MAG: manganese catalase family protein [Clostridia bacterium]|nr:manganese catalase family protein [Clostridia bacterium]MDD4146722.1 manganese catalase family protein [Clostridia bacterium]MDD4665695.1 manganese catalase family protein [Clostridia bacterium]